MTGDTRLERKIKYFTRMISSNKFHLKMWESYPRTEDVKKQIEQLREQIEFCKEAIADAKTHKDR